MIFKWLDKFGDKPDHPMQNMAEARRLLAELPLDAFKAVEEIAFWLGSVRDTEGFRLDRRVEVVKLLDETAQAYQRKLGRDYLTALRMQKFQENRLWLLIFDYWKNAADAYMQCIDEYGRQAKGAEAVKDELPLLAARALRALAAQKKWLHIRYRPVEERIWADIAKLSLLAEAKLFLKSLFPLYPGGAAPGSVQQELLKALVFEMSSPNSLSPTHMDLTDRLVQLYVNSFTFDERPSPASTFYIDMSKAAAPTRAHKGMQLHPMLRFFGSNVAAEKLAVPIQALKEGVMPPELGFGDECLKEDLLDVLEHLRLYWASTPPLRKHMRTRTTSRFNVVYRFPEIRRKIAEGERGVVASVLENKDLLHQERVDLQLYGFVTEKTKQMMAKTASRNTAAEKDQTESWVMDNISAGGFGAVVPQISGDWLKVGILLGLKAEQESKWAVGVVRRLGRDASMRISVGIQTLAREPVSVRLRPLEPGEVSMWEKMADAPSYKYIAAILLPPGAVTAGDATLLIEKGSFVAGRNYLLLFRDEKRVIKTSRLLEEGEDFERVEFVPVDGVSG